jgi:hypothetical protein
MHALNWLNGERMFRIWFGNPANNDPLKGTPDTSTIKMNTWVLTFERAKTVYDKLMSERIWTIPAARWLLIQHLQRDKKMTSNDEQFGDMTGLNMSTIDHQHSINHREVSNSLMDEVLDPLDDMFAALGAFSFKVVVQGHVQPIKSSPLSGMTHRATIEKVGVYVRDSFDFNGLQFLGFWRQTAPDCSRTPGRSYYSIYNSDFRQWRDANNKGGDFLVYSDIKWTTLAIPYLIDCHAARN